MLEYKKIIKDRRVRLKILSLLSFLPDKTMVKLQYWMKTGRRLNLDNPIRFTEKLQWYKLYYKNPLMVKCVDKYDVRDYVKSKGLEDILIPCYGVFDSPDDICWDNLPNQFVMKDTLGGGGTSVVIVKDKNAADIEELKEIASQWVSLDAHKKNAGREWPYYSGKKHRIIIENYIEPAYSDRPIFDYKFFCFDGQVGFVYVMGNRTLGNEVNISIYDADMNPLPVKRKDHCILDNVTKPERYAEMVKIAEILSKDFPHARVDLYNENGCINFGELTFYTASGYIAFEPDEFDIKIGNVFNTQKY